MHNPASDSQRDPFVNALVSHVLIRLAATLFAFTHGTGDFPSGWLITEKASFVSPNNFYSRSMTRTALLPRTRCCKENKVSAAAVITAIVSLLNDMSTTRARHELSLVGLPLSQQYSGMIAP